jgi:hypothetical protein
MKKCLNKVFNTQFTCGEQNNVCSEECLNRLRPRRDLQPEPVRGETFKHNRPAEKYIASRYISTYDVEIFDIDVKTLRNVLENMNENDLLRFKIEYLWGDYDHEGSAQAEILVGESIKEPEEKWILRKAKADALSKEWDLWKERSRQFYRNRSDFKRLPSA